MRATCNEDLRRKRLCPLFPPLREGLSILVPAYNEEASLEQAIRKLLAAAGEACDDFEIVVVNDGSADGTAKILDQVAAREPRVKAFHHERNRGIGAGITTAGRNASCAKAIVCPVDSPLSSEQLSTFLAAAAPDAIVVGYRPVRAGYKAWQQFGSQVYHRMACLLLGLRLRDVNWIQLYPTRLFSELQIEYGGIAYLAEVLAKAKLLGYRFVEVEAPMVARTEGVASISRPRTIWRLFCNLWSLWWRLKVTGQSRPCR